MFLSCPPAVADTPGEDILCVLYDVFDFIEVHTHLPVVQPGCCRWRNGAGRSHLGPTHARLGLCWTFSTAGPCPWSCGLPFAPAPLSQEATRGGRVLIHCSQGVSRSASLAIAYLMWRQAAVYDDVFLAVKAARGVTNPNIGFICQVGGLGVGSRVANRCASRAERWLWRGGCTLRPAQCLARRRAPPVLPMQLLQWHKRRHAPLDSCRLYRIAPQSAAAAQHLVPKPVGAPAGGASLDPRGAFVLHAPAALTIWAGEACPEAFLAAAQRFAGQLQKYEGAPGPAAVVRQGQEPPAFWTSLAAAGTGEGSASRSGSPAAPGGGRPAAAAAAAEVLAVAAGEPVAVLEISSYDKDFEVGGVVRLGLVWRRVLSAE